MKEIALMQIMQPALPYETFNVVILPYHDLRHCEATKWLWQSQDFFIRLLRRCHASPRKNILPINGAINNVTTKFAVAEAELQKYYPKLEEFIAVIIGGNNKKFNFNEKEATLFASLLKTIYTNQKILFFISFSRRTPAMAKTIIKNNMPSSTIIYDPNEDIRHLSKLAYREEFVGNTSPSTAAYTLVREDASTGLTHKLPLQVEFGKISFGFNPYIAMLAKAKYIISTTDSISMCSEAASSGKPLYIFCPENFNSSKHKIFIKQLVEQK